MKTRNKLDASELKTTTRQQIAVVRTSLAVERILAASVRVDSPFSVRGNAAENQLVERLWRADLRKKSDNECNEEREASDQHHDILLRQRVSW